MSLEHYSHLFESPEAIVAAAEEAVIAFAASELGELDFISSMAKYLDNVMLGRCDNSPMIPYAETLMNLETLVRGRMRSNQNQDEQSWQSLAMGSINASYVCSRVAAEFGGMR